LRTPPQALFRTRPLLIQRVQARMRLTPPGVAERTSCRLGFHRRLVLLLAWLTLLPTEGPLPQIAQCLIRGKLSLFSATCLYAHLADSFARFDRSGLR
jgi:hypothetical protein